MIEGVLATPLRRVATPGGDVLHALKASGPGFAGFGEAYFSFIHEGVTKSWRRHNVVAANLIVPVGNVQFAVHDDRPGSVSRGRTLSIAIGERNYARLTIAPGLWFAFRGIGPGVSLILNVISHEHDPAESDTRALADIPFDW